MHNNFYLLRQLAPLLESKIKGHTVTSCFSQNKDELILGLSKKQKSFFIKTFLGPSISYLSFPASVHRARKNSVDLFKELIGLSVDQVRQFSNERSFALEFTNGSALLFKMHDRNANLITFAGGTIHSLFRKHLSGDKSQKLEKLDRALDLSHEAFLSQEGDWHRHYFTFGKTVWAHLDGLGFEKADLGKKWLMVQTVLRKLEHPNYYLVSGARVSMSLLPHTDSIETFVDPIEALNAFSSSFNRHDALTEKKKEMLSDVRGKLKQAESFLHRIKQRLSSLEKEDYYQQWGDLLMANLNGIQRSSESITVSDFHEPTRRIEIPLRKELTPQANAERYYQKAKDRTKELKALAQSVLEKENEVEKWKSDERRILNESEHNALVEMAKPDQKKAKAKSLPYNEHIIQGFRIWVGKNAKSNDELTMKYSYKDDLWLHARDVSGSHVVIKHQAGKAFPKSVIERAAALAAYHSKRKGESLCPVSVTPRKYVRKRKGDPAGAMVVDKEKVILVTPAK